MEPLVPCCLFHSSKVRKLEAISWIVGTQSSGLKCGSDRPFRCVARFFEPNELLAEVVRIQYLRWLIPYCAKLMTIVRRS
jgi:hypothetical protein